jgi:hypothetical protein
VNEWESKVCGKKCARCNVIRQVRGFVINGMVSCVGFYHLNVVTTLSKLIKKPFLWLVTCF